MFIRYLMSGILLLALSSQSFAQSEEPISAKHIFSNASLAFVLNIENLNKLLTADNKQRLEKTNRWLHSSLKLDTSSCTEIIVQYGADEYGEGFLAFDSVGIVFRSKDDIPGKEISSFVNRFDLDESSHNGRSYFQTQSPPMFYFSGNALLLAEKERTHELIDNEVAQRTERSAPITDHLPQNAEICAYVDFSNTSFHPFLVKLFGGANTVQPETILSITKNARSAKLIFETESMTPATLVFELNKGGDIHELGKAANQFMSGAHDFVSLLEKDAGRGGFSEEHTDSAFAFTESLKILFEKSEIDQDEDSVTVSLADTEHFVNSLNHLVKYLTLSAEIFETRGLFDREPGTLKKGRAIPDATDRKDDKK